MRASFVISPPWLTFLVIVSYWSPARKIQLLAGVRFSIPKDGDLFLFFFYGFSNRALQSDSLLFHQNGCLIFHYRVFLPIFIFFLLAVLFKMTQRRPAASNLFIFLSFFFYPQHTAPVCGGRQVRRKQYQAIKFFYYDSDGGVKINAGGADVDTKQIGRGHDVWFGLSGS